MKKLITILSLAVGTNAFAWNSQLTNPDRFNLPTSELVEAVESVKHCPTEVNLFIATNLEELDTEAELVSSKPTVELIRSTVLKDYVYCYYKSRTTNAIGNLKLRLNCNNAAAMTDGSNSDYPVNHVFSCVEYVVKKPNL